MTKQITYIVIEIVDMCHVMYKVSQIYRALFQSHGFLDELQADFSLFDRSFALNCTCMKVSR